MDLKAKNLEFHRLHPDAPQVPPGLKPRPGVEYGCGKDDCQHCYEHKGAN